MVKIPVGWRALVATSKRILTVCAVIVRLDFTESRGPGEYEIGLEVGYLLYMGEGKYDDIRIRILQVSSLVVVAEFAEYYSSQSHTLIIHGAQPQR